MLLAALHPGGCTPGTPADPTTALAGPWLWTGSAGGIVGIRPTPASESLAIIFYFHGDGGLATYRDGRLHQEVRFDLQREGAPQAPSSLDLGYAEPLRVFPFEPGIDRHRVRRLAGDTLILAAPCCDRYEHRFTRLRPRYPSRIRGSTTDQAHRHNAE